MRATTAVAIALPRRWHTLAHFSHGLARALQNLRVTVHLFDAEAPLSSFEGRRLLNTPVDALICFVGKGTPRIHAWSELLQIPVIYYCVDLAPYFGELFQDPRARVITIDRSDVRLVPQLYGFDRISYQPHAASDTPTPVERDRPYEIVFIGKCYDDETISSSWKERYSHPLVTMAHHCLDSLAAHPEAPLFELFCKACAESDLTLPLATYTQLLSEVECCFKARERVRLLQNLEVGHLHLFGPACGGAKGWNHYLANRPNTTFHPPLSIQETLQVMGQSKIVLNSSPAMREGLHERIVHGQIAGAVVATNSSCEVTRNFRPGQELITYESDDWGALNDAVERCLSQPALWKKIAFAGQMRAREEHTWDCRAKELLNFRECTPSRGGL